MAETKKTNTKKEEQIKLNPLVWEVPYNEDLVAQVLYVYNSNERKGTIKQKGRGEVSGGGKKPWRQKGTGRARHGSIRSPLWVGGGVTFASKERNFSRKINKTRGRRQYNNRNKYILLCSKPPLLYCLNTKRLVDNA